ncbi:hypothetical protein HanHA300_Chr09g0325861 [Helianthus annuus]|nr:hypothetical protein HanHA300_Chr09g0325861 [Helianthus annuus]KAJ0535193.1 hypothetical protein HanIR_Chr09g0428041 [Helianthus annuus]KAJ0543073.1 hypothetical protein HanHA89_Chr09g0346781 [Helianthus annuus]KAJ0708126.1 hypothetical protein HanLR1_Chr09g0326091 [Helianthus annuus]
MINCQSAIRQLSQFLRHNCHKAAIILMFRDYGIFQLDPSQGLCPLDPAPKGTAPGPPPRGRCSLGTPVEYGLRPYPYTSNYNNSNKHALPHLLTCLMCIIIRFDHQVNPDYTKISNTCWVGQVRKGQNGKQLAKVIYVASPGR